MWEETGQQNMPEFSKFKRKQVTKLFRLREIGLTSNLIQSCYRRATENSYSDLHFARSLLCDEQAYLEVSDKFFIKVVASERRHLHYDKCFKPKKV